MWGHIITIWDEIKTISRDNRDEWNSALAFFIEALENEDPTVRVKAILNREYMKDIKALAPLYQMRKDENAQVRYAAEKALRVIVIN